MIRFTLCVVPNFCLEFIYGTCVFTKANIVPVFIFLFYFYLSRPEPDAVQLFSTAKRAVPNGLSSRLTKSPLVHLKKELATTLTI